MKKPNELAAQEKTIGGEAKSVKIKRVLGELEKIVKRDMRDGTITASGGTFEWPDEEAITYVDSQYNSHIDHKVMQSIKTYFAQHGWKFAYKKVEEEGWSMTACSSTSWTEYHFTITPRKGDAGGD